MGKPPRLAHRSTIDLPVVEASGLATRSVDGGVRLLVIGDRSARIAGARIGPDGIPSEWETLDLAEIEQWPDFGADSQFEAVAADGGSIVALLCEDPPTVFVTDTATRTLRARIGLSVTTGSPLDGHWIETSNSRGEGLVLLRGGRLLVAKEKRPTALVEFCPPGVGPRGLSPDDFLGPDESWESPDEDVEFTARSVWILRKQAKDALRDVSALGVGSDGGLWMLSDKSASLGLLRLDPPLPPGEGEIRELDDLWRLPKGTRKPEGMAALDDDRLMIALDTDERTGNGIVVETPGR